MIHHDNRGYAVAKSESAKAMKIKLEGMFDAGKKNVVQALEKLQADTIQDFVVPRQKIKFDTIDDGFNVMFGDEQYDLHWHARNQISQRLKIPKPYVDRLCETKWGRELLVTNLNELLGHHEAAKFLLRTINGSIRGWLSDKYRRMDSAPIIESFIGAINDVGAVPMRARMLDTKVSFAFILPVMFEPTPDEIVAFGLEFKNSDFGHGRLLLNEFMYRMWCTNLATGIDYMAKTHLGTRLSDDIEYNEETYTSDTKTLALAVKDTVHHALGADNVNQRVQLISEAAKEMKSEDLMAVIKNMKDKAKLNKGETDRVTELFRSADVQMLPRGNSAWRLSNAISMLAGQTDDGYRAQELEALAGQVAGLSK